MTLTGVALAIALAAVIVHAEKSPPATRANRPATASGKFVRPLSDLQTLTIFFVASEKQRDDVLVAEAERRQLAGTDGGRFSITVLVAGTPAEEYGAITSMNDTFEHWMAEGGTVFITDMREQ